MAVDPLQLEYAPRVDEREQFRACYDARLRESAGRAEPRPARQAPRVLASGPSTAEGPLWTIGDEWAYRWESSRGKGTFVWVVDREEVVESVGYYVLLSGGREIYRRRTDLASYMEKLDGVMVIRHSPPRLNYVWPLAVGKTWEQSYAREDLQERQSREITRIWRVEAEEDLTVPAGAFRTLRIVSRNQRTGALVLEEWYAPAVKQMIRLRDHLPFGVEERELTSFNVR